MDKMYNRLVWLVFILVSLLICYSWYGFGVWQDFANETVFRYRGIQFQILDIEKELGMVPEEHILGEQPSEE